MRVLGLDYNPWIIRNLFLPDVMISPILGLASMLGVESVRILRWIATFPFIALASVNIILVYLLGLNWLENEWAATLAASIFAFHWLPLGYGSTVYPRTVSITCVLVGVLMIVNARRPILGHVAAGAAIGVAFACRYSEAIFLLPIVALVFLGKAQLRGRLLLALALGCGFLITTAITVGLWDLVTWGSPFSSLIEFARYTLIEKESSAMDEYQPWSWYLWRLPKWLPVATLPLFFGVRDNRRLCAPALYIALPLIVLSMIPHKEMRYLLGITPFIAIAVAGAASDWWQLGRRRLVVVLMSLSLLTGITIPTFVFEKSMAAVLAAEAIGAEPDVRVIALSQSWAYGEGLFFPETAEIRELGAYPGIAELSRIAQESDRVGLFRDRLSQVPEIEGWLRVNGFELSGEFDWGWSRPVTVFNRVSASPTLLEKTDDVLVTCPVRLGEMTRDVRVHVQHSDGIALSVADRHDDLGPAARVAGDVAGEGLHVVHKEGLVTIDPGPAHAHVTLEDETGHRTLVRLDHEILAAQEVEPGP